MPFPWEVDATTGSFKTDTQLQALFDARYSKLGGIANMLMPGLFPNPIFPKAYKIGSAIGDNDIYAVPAGRKAIVTDYIVTNATGGSIVHYPEIKPALSALYYQLGNAANEGAAGIGHNYGMSPTIGQSMPIVLNEADTFAVNCDSVALSIWANIVEFDAVSPVSRASLYNTIAAGDNTLFTVPAGKTLQMGAWGLSFGNNPNQLISGITYRNQSGAPRTVSGIWLIPFGGSKSNFNQFMGNNVPNSGAGLNKYFHGNLGPGDFIVINIDANTAKQFVWFNYTLN